MEPRLYLNFAGLAQYVADPSIGQGQRPMYCSPVRKACELSHDFSAGHVRDAD